MDEQHKLLIKIASDQSTLMGDVRVLTDKFAELKDWKSNKDNEIKNINEKIVDLEKYHANEEGKRTGVLWMAGSIGAGASFLITTASQLFSGYFHR